MIQLEYRDLSILKKLPNNARVIRDAKFKSLCQSIEKNKDYFEARPIILSDRTGELIIIAGNQRYDAASYLRFKEVPTVLIPDLTEEKEKEIIIRDNVSSGDWNFEMLAQDYDPETLQEWGMDSFSTDGRPTINNDEPEYPLVPEFDEHYDAIIIVCSNSIDTTFIKNALQIEQAKSYKNNHVGESNIITADQFIKLWQSK